MTLAPPPLRRRNKSRRKPPSRTVPFTAAEFFAGIGLVRLALEKEHWKVLWANDIDLDKAEMYHANFGKADLVVGDIHQIPAASIPDCTLYTASFPCNDLSIAGAMAGLSGKESSAFWGLIKILRDKGENRPPLVLLENVVGFLQSNGGKDLETALLALNNLGYTVDAVILNAVHWVPQSRARLFIVAKRDIGTECNQYAMETGARPDALFEFINLHPNIRWDILELPPLPKPKFLLPEIVEDLAENDPHWWSRERCEYFYNQLSEKHLLSARLARGLRKITYFTAFRRVRNGRSMAELRTDQIAGCLRTPRGGSGRQILFKAGYGKFRVRLLTARECARLQGVPDSYDLEGIKLNQALFGFGDAVCVPAVRWIARHYLDALAANFTTAGTESVLFE